MIHMALLKKGPILLNLPALMQLCSEYVPHSAVEGELQSLLKGKTVISRLNCGYMSCLKVAEDWAHSLYPYSISSITMVKCLQM